MPSPVMNAELACVMRLSVMRLARRLRAQRADHTLTLTQLATLATLERHGQLSPRELADHERVQPPSMTRTLAGLEERGLVTRARHATDGRQQVVSLTPAAAQMLRDDRRRRDAWLAQRLDDFSVEERATLRAAVPLLERLGQL
jgi:DNA-binding MarR family transcriptional regulator